MIVIKTSNLEDLTEEELASGIYDHLNRVGFSCTLTYDNTTEMANQLNSRGSIKIAVSDSKVPYFNQAS